MSSIIHFSYLKMKIKINPKKIFHRTIVKYARDILLDEKLEMTIVKLK